MTFEPQDEYLYLTTTGHKSGNPHEIEIWFVYIDRRFYLISEGRERAHWVQNIQHDPAVTFRVGEQQYQGDARVVDAAQEADLAEAVRVLMQDKYNWSDGLIVEIQPR